MTNLSWMPVMLSVSHQLLCVQITIEAMKSDIDEVALQGIEFWSNVCDEEMDLAIEATEVMLVFHLQSASQTNALVFDVC